jgi:hypothetical protein
VSPVSNRSWPKGYRSGHCISDHHSRCRGGVFTPSGYHPCTCKCGHPHIFEQAEEETEEFFGEAGTFTEEGPFLLFPDEELYDFPEESGR